MHEKSAVPVENVHQVVPAGPDVQVREVDMPFLIRPFRVRRPPQWIWHERRAPREKVGLLPDLVDLAWPQVGDVLIHHHPGLSLVAHEGMRQREAAHRRPLIGCRRQRRAGSSPQTIGQAAVLRASHPPIVGRL